MTLIVRLLAAGAFLSAAVNAVSVTPGEVLARHRQHAHPQRHSAEPDVVERNTSVELEERSSPKKCGLGWATNSEQNIPHFTSSQTNYIYTWSPYCPANAAQHGLECCPMLWGTKQISEFEANKYKGGKCILGMNEVNVPSQGQLTVKAGVALWNKYVYPLAKQGYYLVSPSTTSGKDGIAWLKQFYDTCGELNCGASATAMHYYGTNVNDFISWAEQFHALGPHEVWVTEIACQSFGGGKQCNQGEVYDFMDGAIAWMKKTEWIKCYFFFGLFWDMYNVNTLNRMADKNGKPNALGLHYINA